MHVLDPMDPRSRLGHLPAINTEQEVQQVESVRSSASARIGYLELVGGPFRHWKYDECKIRHTLARNGHNRYPARIKPVLSAENKVQRLSLAQGHLMWTTEQWSQVLWPNESRATGTSHRWSWVIRSKYRFQKFIILYRHVI